MLCMYMTVWQISRLTTRANSVAVGIPLLAIAAPKRRVPLPHKIVVFNTFNKRFRDNNFETFRNTYFVTKNHITHY